LVFPFGTSLDVTIEYSLDGGKTYSDCVENTANQIGGQDNPSEGLDDLEAGPAGVSHVFAWDIGEVQALQNQNANWILVRITTDEGARAVSQYLTVTYNGNDSDAPTITKLSAVAVEGASNDTIRIVYSEPVDETEAEKRGNYIVKNPAGTAMTIPQGSTIDYDPILKRTTITLDGDGTANLKYGEDCTVRVKNVTDLAGNAIVNGAGDSLTSQVNGDGANLPDDQPMLELVYFDGAGGPTAGEYLCMIFDEEIALNEAATFDDNDVDFFDGGDRLGTNSPIAIELIDDFTVQVTLGTSPVFTPSSSRINIPDLNDKITDLAGNKPYMDPSPGRNDYELIIALDTTRPKMDLVTLNEIPDILNGKGEAGGELLVPRNRFDIYLEYHDVGGAGVDTSRVEIICTSAVTHDGSSVPANTDLVPYLTERSKDSDSALYHVPAKMTFPDGTNKIRARVWDLMENASFYKSFTFEVTATSNNIRPFETQVNPNQRWNLVFTRDLYTISAAGTNTITVTATETPNGTPDFREDMLVLGFRSTAPINVPGTGGNSNKLMEGFIHDAIKTELSDTIFAGVNISFTEEDEGGLPGNAAQTAYSSFTHSQIAIGGESDVGALGVAFVDRANANQDNDVLYAGSAPYNPGVHLGVFTTRMLKYEINGSVWSNFRITFDDFIPGRGTPVGEGADDQDILMDMAGTGPAVNGAAETRKESIELGLSRLGRYIAVITAHEMGHSMGLAVDGACPDGLHGGDPDNFPGSNSNHIDLSAFPELYTLPAINIMVPATNFWMATATGTRFNKLNMAFLKETIYYNP
jgi:hypothetical protein